MPNIRMLPPLVATQQSIAVNGRQYTATPGSVVDVPDFDAPVLAANGWTTVARSGPTAQRPKGVSDLVTGAFPGTHFLDTTVGKLIIFDGATWRDPVTGAAA